MSQPPHNVIATPLFLVCFTASLLAGSTPAAAQTPESLVRAGRLVPPTRITCEPDQLSTYSGRVTGYVREPGVTSITIHTDWNTSETVLVKHPGSNDPSARFLINGRPFSADDWALIEAGHGMIREDTRLTAWVCSDGVTPALIDWQPNGDLQ